MDTARFQRVLLSNLPLCQIAQRVHESVSERTADLSCGHTWPGSGFLTGPPGASVCLGEAAVAGGLHSESPLPPVTDILRQQ